jgi:polar amino acid transport system substrate-binding protein
MYYAKKKGKNDFQFFQKSMNEIVQETINMSNKMRTALDRNEFLLYYQPKMNIKSGKIVGFEALIRWNQGDKGIVFPRDFIPFAEDHNLISFVTNWVINDVCRQLCEWKKAELNLLPVSINLPINQFNKQDFIPYLTKITDSYNISPKLIELEVTESIFMDDMKSTNSKLNELISMGFQISIDDFGTGFSSLNRLKEIPCNIIKIEKSFIESINDNTPDNVIVSSIISMGHGLNMEVQAEGVESEVQYKFLELNHCDTLQGFILSPPVPAEEIRTILKKESEGKGIGIKLANKMRR